MSATIAQWTATTAVNNLIAQTSMNALGNLSWATGAGTLTSNSGTPRRLYLEVELILSSAVTAGTGSPGVDIYILYALDGTNVPNPPGTSAALTPGGYFFGTIQANASASFTRGFVGGILKPFPYAIVIQNRLGVAFPSTNTNAINGYVYREEVSAT